MRGRDRGTERKRGRNREREKGGEIERANERGGETERWGEGGCRQRHGRKGVEKKEVQREREQMKPESVEQRATVFTQGEVKV